MPSRIQWSCSVVSTTTGTSRRTTAIAKGKNRRSKGIQRHRLLDQDSEAVDAGPKVDRLAMQVNLEISAKSEHDPALR